jgi:hypothetical protein
LKLPPALHIAKRLHRVENARSMVSVDGARQRAHATERTIKQSRVQLQTISTLAQNVARIVQQRRIALNVLSPALDVHGTTTIKSACRLCSLLLLHVDSSTARAPMAPTSHIPAKIHAVHAQDPPTIKMMVQ